MPWREIGLNAAGLLLYPGLLATGAVGVVLEIAGQLAMGPGRGFSGSAGQRIQEIARQVTAGKGRRLHLLVAALLTALATVQVAAPFSPVPAGDRNLLTGAVSLTGCAWILWTWGSTGPAVQPRLLLAVQLAWLVALLVPAVIPQTLKPQTLGYVTLRADLPVKVACGILYLLCLPALLHLVPVPTARPPGVGRQKQEQEQGHKQAAKQVTGQAGMRFLLWLPYCGLFASLFFPPPGTDSPLELLRFLGVVTAAAASTVFIALFLRHLGAGFVGRFYSGVVLPFAWISLAVGMLSAALASR